MIARLTSFDDDESDDFAKLTLMLSQSPSAQLDPLMGCSGTLFPIIGRVANLVRWVCKNESNSPSMISKARSLEDDLKRWKVPPPFNRPSDQDVRTLQCRQMSEAYRWAALLYLYQAVPELPSAPASKLGKKVLKLLATTGPEDDAIIIQIFPLMAAGCEATNEEDRQWVRDRWQSMMGRMWISNVDRCRDVAEEVWRRRDRWGQGVVDDWSSMNAEQQQGLRNDWDLMANIESNRLLDDEARRMIMCSRNINRPARKTFMQVADDDIEGSMERAFTVRGELHWVGVMKDLNFESELLEMLDGVLTPADRRNSFAWLIDVTSFWRGRVRLDAG